MRDASSYAFANIYGAFVTGRYPVIDRTSTLQTRVAGGDTTVWYSSSIYWQRNAAASVRAALGTGTLARPQQLRVMYQLKDAHGNTRVGPAASPSVTFAGGSLACGGKDGTSGIGQCSGTLPRALFATTQSVPLTLVWGSTTLPAFATVSLQQEPLWSRNGAWNDPIGAVSQNVAFGAVLPYEDVYIAPGQTSATVSAHVYLKTHIAEDSTAERQVAVGMFKLVYPSTACSVTGDSGRNGAFATWEAVGGLSPGEYGLLFRNGAVEGASVLMVTIALSCGAGTHSIGIETTSFSDSNGLSSSPSAVYDTSVGRGDGYVAQASVFVKATTQNIAHFGYPADGRANLNNLQMIGQ